MTEIASLRERINLVQEFMSSPSRRYLFGATPYAQEIIRKIEIGGVVDEGHSEGKFCDVPVVRFDEIPDDAIIICTMVGRPKSALRRVQLMGRQACDYFAFHRFSGLKLESARFVSGYQESAKRSSFDSTQLFERLSDDISRKTFNAICEFRRTMDISHLSDFEDKQDSQYFEDFLNLKDAGEVFADVGSFDGKTSLDFIDRCPHYESIFAFEPDPGNMVAVKNRLGALRDVHIYPFGLGEIDAMARFQSGGSTSHMSTSGGHIASIRTLDSFNIETLSFLKMDVEGAELQALKGARGTITRCAPRLAISVYHQPNDLELPLLNRTLCGQMGSDVLPW